MTNQSIICFYTIPFLQSLTIKHKLKWKIPLINITDTDIVLEWWNGVKKLTIYIPFDHTKCSSYIKVWGVNMDNEMEDGFITSINDLVILITWIFQ